MKPLNGQVFTCWIILTLQRLSTFHADESFDPIDVNVDFRNLTLDYRPFRNMIRNVIANSSTLPSTACAIPNKAIMFSYTNHHTFYMIDMQHRAMDIHHERGCLEKRYITVCLDRKCMTMCDSNKIFNCVLLKFPKTNMGNFGNNIYHYMTWLKHELMFQALQVADELFFFDADVLLFKNPFPGIKFGRDKNGGIIEDIYDIQYQRERGMKERGCGGSVNSGQMYLRNSTSIQHYFKLLFQRKIEILENKNRLDQDHVGDLVGNLRYCTLPVRQYKGYCPASQDSSSGPLEMITFHTNCASGNEKRLLLNRMLDDVSRAKSRGK
eukprot:gene10094-21031_t